MIKHYQRRFPCRITLQGPSVHRPFSATPYGGAGSSGGGVVLFYTALSTGQSSASIYLHLETGSFFDAPSFLTKGFIGAC